MRVRVVRHPRRGATAVEVALVLSVTLLLLFGLLEYGRLFLMKQTMENAAREGARWAVVHTDITLSNPGDPEQEISDKVKSFLVGLDAKVANFDVTVKGVVLRPGPGETQGAVLPVWTDAKENHGIQVEVRGDFEPVIPAFLRMGATVPLRATAVMYSEAN